MVSSFLLLLSFILIWAIFLVFVLVSHGLARGMGVGRLLFTWFVYLFGWGFLPSSFLSCPRLGVFRA